MLNLWGSGRYERNVKQQNTHQPNVFSSIRVNDKLVSILPFLLPFFWKNHVFIINIFIWFNRQMFGWRFEMHTFVFQACSNCCTARCSYHATCKVHKSTNAIAWMNCTQRFTCTTIKAINRVWESERWLLVAVQSVHVSVCGSAQIAALLFI